MRNLQKVVIVLGVFAMLFAATSLRAQTDFSVKIYVEDGSGWKDSVQIGKYTSATDAIGDSISPTLVENELPPVPPSGGNQAPDLRLITPPGGPSYGQGVAVDLRLLVSDGQSNTYRLSFRRTDPEGTAITLSWPSGLGAISGGGFYMTDGFGGFLFPAVDMSSSTSFTHATFNGLGGSFVDIIVGDGSMMRTFTNYEIALAVDYKGKGKAEKRKPHAVDFAFDLTNPGTAFGINLALDFSMVCDVTLSFPGDTTGRMPINLASAKKYTPSFVPPLDSGQVVHIEGRGVKGKAVKTKYFFGDQKKAEVGSYIYQYLRMRMPNINNVGEEIYLQSGNMGIGLTSQVGSTIKGKPIFRSISLPKFKDVQKTMFKFKNIQMFQDGDAHCLDTIKSKENIKLIKSIDPAKTIRYKDVPEQGNLLIGELIALKFNILASAKEKTPSQGFGELTYVGPEWHLYGRTVNSIAGFADSAISCVQPGITDTGFTFQDLAELLGTLNAEFSGPFDTVSFGGPGPGKPTGGTVATGVKPVALSSIFIGSGATFAPAAPADFSEFYDVPKAFSLSQNYPNPFNPTTTIEFSIPEDAIVTLHVYNMLGQLVATLADREEFSGGENQVELDGAKLSTGVYYYQINVNDGQFQEVLKMVLMK